MLKARVIAYTIVVPSKMKDASGGAWEPDEDVDVESGGMLDQASTLAQFAGRACYESWPRPNPATADNHGYCNHILEVGHFSVIEHGSVSFHFTGVSRSFTHELVRHRHFSYSQLSQRYANLAMGPDEKPQEGAVVPPLFRGHQATEDRLAALWEAAVREYHALVEEWTPIALAAGYEPLRARKVVREAARSVLPNMTPTKLVVTGNHRTWREFLEKRATIHADAEMREVAIAVYHQLAAMEPALYQDFAVERGPLNEMILVRRESD